MEETADCNSPSDEHRGCRGVQGTNGSLPTFDPLASRDNGQILSQEEPNFEKLIEHVTNNIFLLILHLSGRGDSSIGGIELDHPNKFGHKLNLIDAVCQNTWPSVRGPSRCDRAAILFKVYDKLSHAAAPVTAMTVAYTLLVAPKDEVPKDEVPKDKVPKDEVPKGEEPKSASPSGSMPCGYPHHFAQRAYPHLVESARRCRKWIDQLPAVMLIALIATSLLSWYVGYGKFILLRVEQLDAQRTEIGRALDLVEKSQTMTTISDKPGRRASTEAWVQDEKHLGPVTR